jgi:AmiR/NasT family two-component response regulator
MTTFDGYDGVLGEMRSMEDARAAVLRMLAVTHSAYERSSQLQRALDSRVVIEQAKGVLAERYAIDVQQAFDLLRRGARSNRMPLRELAASVVASRSTPPEITAVLD